MLENGIERDLMSDSNLNYDRKAAKEYAENYGLTPNRKEYPYFKDNDCANFVSQVLRAGGMDEEGTEWDKFESWFCNTTDEKDLTKIALTWRSARYFRRHWSNENGIGRNRAFATATITVQQALDNFNRIYFLLKEGDVIQYGEPTNNNLPYHTQVIHDKGFNWKIKGYDLFMAQHTKNSIYVSLYNYLTRLENKNERFVYIYKIKND
ncbi:amidase domain-containing protein [Clostridium sp. MB40-C1]|uniref:amidase domain-containing protein n=1 Tax=Clostridium sp. MB40-C1 TaxID=3070996 RepID=UPI0027DF2BAE|nr:amidase domain-containing protein [Clostridium sp. MB40-C1]WMJ80139.1 amidase domain-containing protein [Clostridium sp. MB40-C1]